MKKWVCLLLAFSLVLTLAACGGEEPVETQAPTEAVVENHLQRVTITAVPNGLLGFVGDGIYGNALLGIEFAAGDGWDFYSDTELAQLCGITEGVSQEAFEEKLRQTGTIYTMYAENEEEASSASVVFEHMGYVYGASMTEEAFAELMLEQASLRRPGIDVGVSSASLSSMWLAGGEHPCLELVYTAYGVTHYQTQVFLQSGEFMAVISGTAVHKNDDASIVADFSALSFTPEASSAAEESQAEE